VKRSLASYVCIDIKRDDIHMHTYTYHTRNTHKHIHTQTHTHTCSAGATLQTRVPHILRDAPRWTTCGRAAATASGALR
jgi:hypothetical protein